MPKSLLITQCNIITDPFFFKKDHFVRIEDGFITAIGPMTQPHAKTADHVINGRNKLVIPGLINGHCHSPMTLFRGMADDLDLSAWLHNHIFPAEAAHISKESVYWCSRLAAAEMLLAGTTCVADAYFYSDQTAQAFAETGIRGVVGHAVFDIAAPGMPDPTRQFDIVGEYLRRWKHRSPLITPAIFAHSPYTCSPATLRNAKKLADDNNVRFFIHLAESFDEHRHIIDPVADTPLRHLHTLGILDDNCVLIHAIWLDDHDLDILSESKAQVILCPQSNYKLASGRSRATDMAALGIPLGLGTDGPASNNSLDMFREMDLLAKSSKAHHLDPTVFPAAQVFTMATYTTNTIIGMSSPNSLQMGSRADLALIDLCSPHLTPFYNENLVVYGVGGADVDTVIVDGKIVVEKGEIITIDVRKTMDMVAQLAKAL